MAKNTAPVENGEKLVSDDDIWSGLQEIKLDRPMFNPNEGCNLPIKGYLINMIAMPPVKRGKELQDWECLLIKLTRPTKVLNRQKELVTAQVGDEVLMPVTYQLNQGFLPIAAQANKVYEVAALPLEKVKIPKSSQTMWTWRLGVDMNTIKTRDQFGPTAILSGGTDARALPARGQSTSEAITVAGESVDEVPF